MRARIDGEIIELDDVRPLDRYKQHTIEAIIDRVVVRRYDADDTERQDADRGRLSDSVETALDLGDGVAIVSMVGGEDRMYSERYACPVCGISLPEIEPRSFSFNSPHGACPDCTGLGTRQELDPVLIVPDVAKSVDAGAIEPWAKAGKNDSYFRHLLEGVAAHYGFDTHQPWGRLSAEQQRAVLYGSNGEMVTVRYVNQHGQVRSHDTAYEGVIPNLERRYRETSSDSIRASIEAYMTERECPTCHGRRLRPESLAVTVDGQSIDKLTDLPIGEAITFVQHLNDGFDEREMLIARQILKELLSRLRFLMDVGLHYLTLSRGAATLSGGEAQRIRLATQIGSQLMGVLYILDEPSIGLHQRDNQKLIETLIRLRDLGNTVLVVEHDEATMYAADYIVDLGPGAGEHGGEVVAQGTLADIIANPQSITGQYLSGQAAVPVPQHRRAGNGKWLEVLGARENNLKNVNVRLPLGRFVTVTGVSGSGKSSLLMDIVHRRLAQVLNRAGGRAGRHDEIRGIQYLDKVIDIDQSPIGRTPRSNPATYTNVFGPIRDLFAATPEAKVRGYKSGRFSFNVKGGRCEACQGAGIIQIEMQFLPDVYVPCDVCHGQRYNREALEVKYKGASIAEVLDMTVDEALRFFENVPSIYNKLQTLHDVGLGYIRLGQPATTLSGGEAQRIKLARELSRRATGKTLYILDEPTVGLHMADVERLLQVLARLVEAGNTVAVIEHNLDVIKSADWVIDMGPDGGNAGGRVVAEGTPEEIAAHPTSYTGQFLRPILNAERPAKVEAEMAQAQALAATQSVEMES